MIKTFFFTLMITVLTISCQPVPDVDGAAPQFEMGKSLNKNYCVKFEEYFWCVDQVNNQNNLASDAKVEKNLNQKKPLSPKFGAIKAALIFSFEK